LRNALPLDMQEKLLKKFPLQKVKMENLETTGMKMEEERRTAREKEPL
jgi:hypothetical protein